MNKQELLRSKRKDWQDIWCECCRNNIVQKYPNGVWKCWHCDTQKDLSTLADYGTFYNLNKIESKKLSYKCRKCHTAVLYKTLNENDAYTLLENDLKLTDEEIRARGFGWIGTFWIAQILTQNENLPFSVIAKAYLYVQTTLISSMQTYDNRMISQLSQNDDDNNDTKEHVIEHTSDNTELIIDLFRQKLQLDRKRNRLPENIRTVMVVPSGDIVSRRLPENTVLIVGDVRKRLDITKPGIIRFKSRRDNQTGHSYASKLHNGTIKEIVIVPLRDARGHNIKYYNFRTKPSTLYIITSSQFPDEVREPVYTCLYK